MGRRDVIRRGKQAGRKRILDARGTWVEVSYKRWKREVVTNPTGPTALKAKRDKDPDLKNVSIDVIQMRNSNKSGTGEPVKTPLGEARPTIERGLKGATTKERLKRLLFREAADGKGYKKHTIPLTEESKDGKKSKKGSKKE